MPVHFDETHYCLTRHVLFAGSRHDTVCQPVVAQAYANLEGFLPDITVCAVAVLFCAWYISDLNLGWKFGWPKDSHSFNEPGQADTRVSPYAGTGSSHLLSNSLFSYLSTHNIIVLEYIRV
jgi:hypothetical protein